MTLVYESNFASTGLVTSTEGSATAWATTIAPGDNRQLNVGTEAQYYFDQDSPNNPFSIEDGIVTITAKPVSADSNPLGMLYGSGCLTMFNMLKQPHGRWEVDCMLPQMTGMWPGVWLDSNPYSEELDLAENFGQAQTQTTQHGMNSQKQWQTPDIQFTVPDWSTKFHRLAVEVGKHKTTMFLDTKEINSMPTLACFTGTTPLFLIINLAVFKPGTWSPPPAPGAVGVLKIRNVRVWSN